MIKLLVVFLGFYLQSVLAEAPVESLTAVADNLVTHKSTVSLKAKIKPVNCDGWRNKYSELTKKIDVSRKKLVKLQQTIQVLQQQLAQQKALVKQPAVVKIIAKYQLSDYNSSARSDALYHEALSQLQAQRPIMGARLLQRYLNQFADGKYVADSYYWLGEINFEQQKDSLSSGYFRKLQAKFPAYNKLAVTYLRLAIIMERNNNLVDAESTLKQLVKLYPATTAAKLAKIKLNRHY